MAKTRFLNVFGPCDVSVRFLGRLGRASDQSREIKGLLQGFLEVNGVKSETREGKGTEKHSNNEYDPELAWAGAMTAPRMFVKKAKESQLVQRLTDSSNVAIGGSGLALSAVLYQIEREGEVERGQEQEWWTSDLRSPH